MQEDDDLHMRKLDAEVGGEGKGSNRDQVIPFCRGEGLSCREERHSFTSLKAAVGHRGQQLIAKLVVNRTGWQFCCRWWQLIA